MGKKNSKLKQETVDKLISETYCECSRKTFHLKGFISLLLLKVECKVKVLSKNNFIINSVNNHFFHFMQSRKKKLDNGE